MSRRRLRAFPAGLAVVAAGLLALSAGAPVDSRAQPPPGCQPLAPHELTNGDPAVVEGAVRMKVDALGAFGGAAGAAVFNPPGAAAASTVRISSLYLSHVGRFLADDCSEVQMKVVEPSSEARVVTEGENPLLGRVRVTQTLSPVTAGSSTLTQTYELTNVSAEPIRVAFVRHLDGDLLFDGSINDLAGADADGSRLFEFDAGDRPASPSTLLATTGALDGDASPERWTVRPYDYKPTIVGSGGIPAADSGVVHRDGDGNRISDAPFDASVSQQWSREIASGQSSTFTTVTQFGGNRAPLARPDVLGTDREVPATINVLANDSDPDGDPLQLTSGAPAAAHGSVSCTAAGACTYTPAADYVGPDAFTYTIADGRAGGASATVTVSVASTPPPVTGESVNVQPVAGTVLVRLPGTDRFVLLSDLASIPVGTQVDTTAGTVRLTSARPDGARESSDFFDGLFTVLQSKAGEAVTVLRLDGGDFSDCSGSARRSSSFFAEKPKRKLWGKGKGKFRTRGRFSAATVRGTTWLTSDGCDGTLTRVTEGSVNVIDFSRGVEVVIRAGQSYLATGASRSLAGRACTITGTAGRDTLRGTRGRDVICGGDGNDILLGLGGDDLLLGGDGRDVLRGGEGRDELTGGAGRDVLEGGNDLDLLDGGGGDDVLTGGPGDDVLAGGPGDDRLNGGPGRDRLDGGGGNDFLVAKDKGRGNDSVVGGPGRDRCRTDFIRVCP